MREPRAVGGSRDAGLGDGTRQRDEASGSATVEKTAAIELPANFELARPGSERPLRHGLACCSLVERGSACPKHDPEKWIPVFGRGFMLKQ